MKPRITPPLLLSVRNAPAIDNRHRTEIRRESYSNRFATALKASTREKRDDQPRRSGFRLPVSASCRPWLSVSVPVRTLPNMEFLRKNTDPAAKITLPVPFHVSPAAKNEFYKDAEELAMGIAERFNA